MEPDQQSTVVAAERDTADIDSEKTPSDSAKCDDVSENVKTENLPTAVASNNKNIVGESGDEQKQQQREEVEERREEASVEQKAAEESDATKTECDSASRVENNNSSKSSSDKDDSADKKSETVESQCTADKSAEANANSSDNGEQTKEVAETISTDDSTISEEKKSVDGSSSSSSTAVATTTTSEDVRKEKSPSPTPPPESSTAAVAAAAPSSSSKPLPEGKFEIDSSSLLDRIILHTLKNTVVDNSRLNAAKNKYMMNNGNVNSSNNITSSSSTNNNSNSSNGSDSNPSSKSVEKLIEEFKGSCKSNIANNTPSVSAKEQQQQQQQLKSDNSEVTNGADRNLCSSVKSEAETKSLDTDRLPNLAISSSSSSLISSAATLPPIHHAENEALDFRDSSSVEERVAAPAMLVDLSVKRDEREKSVPPIKRSHALYVGLPDFSKQIFTAPSITRTTNTMTSQGAANKQPHQSVHQQPVPHSSAVSVPKVKNPDFTAMSRAPELQMRHPDFAKGFAKSGTPSPVNVPVTPSNFPEIARKNNYISDLQLKPPTSSSSSSSSSSSTSTSPMAPSTSYKIDYRPPVMPPQQQQQQQQLHQVASRHGAQQQPTGEEPMAHIIHKNQFLPTPDASNWSEHHRSERLLGGSSHSMPPFASSEDLRRVHPAHYSYAYSKEHEARVNEFSLKQKEQQLRQEGTIITIKNDVTMKASPKEFPERRSADLFRDYKLKQPKESPDTQRRMNEPQQPPPLVYHQQYPDFPSNYPRPPKHAENAAASQVKVNPHSPAPSGHMASEYSQPMIRQYQSPSPVHRHDKSPMNPPQNWPPPPPLVQQQQQQQSPRHAISPATTLSSLSPTHHYQHHQHHQQHPNVSKVSPSQSPISSYPHYPPMQKTPQQQHQPPQQPPSFKYPEPSRIGVDVKSGARHPQSDYYHQKYPDFARKFDGSYASAPEPHHANKYPPATSFVPIVEAKPVVVHESLQHALPMRHDLEIRTIREQQQQQLTTDNRNAQYRQQQQPSSSYYPQPHASRMGALQEHPRMPLQEGAPHFARIEAPPPPRVPPDLKIEKRIEEAAQKLYSPIPTRRAEPIPELSIIAKVKAEPPSTPVPREVGIIKSTKSLFAEVKRESPLDLSVKTVKTKADSTGCDQDFHSRYRKEHKVGLKVEFTPNFGNVAKTECRQQARLGPPEFGGERAMHTVPVRYAKETSSRMHPAPVAPTSSSSSSSSTVVKNHYYGQKPPQGDLDRPHAPVASVSANYFGERTNRHAIPPQQTATTAAERSYENHRHESHTGYQPNPPPLTQATNIPYPVINKAPSAAEQQQQRVPPHAPINPKDPLYLERERDRKYVEDILYGRNRREQPQYPPEARPFHISPSPPRKRHLEMSQQQQQQQQQIYDSMPPKQSRMEEPPLLLPPKMYNPPPHINHSQQQHVYGEARDKVSTPPAHLARHENYSRATAAATQPPPPPPTMKHYPLPRKDVIKSAEMMSYNNNANSSAVPTTSYYPNPKAEMIHRSDPMNSHKYYNKDDRYLPQQQQQMAPHHPHHNQVRNQNFHQRPDDTTFPIVHARLPHPVAEIGSKIEQHLTPGPLSNNLGEQRHVLNGMAAGLSGSNGNIARGADQSTIQKLKSNLEFKEMQKLKIQSAEGEQQQQQQQQSQKSELSPRQFRTKGELKGYIPLPMNADSKAATDLPPSAFDLLDWGSACNDFVQQLQTGKKRAKRKRTQIKSSGDEKTLARIPGTTNNDLSEVPKEILQSIAGGREGEQGSSSDEDKPLLALKNSISQSSLTESVPEKLSRDFREKQRLELEQKMAARLGRPSSSESETDTRKHLTIVRRVRRLRKRAALGIKKTDDERTAEEEGETDGVMAKAPSKLDDLTSSDEESKKKHHQLRPAKQKASDEKSTKKSPKDGRSAKRGENSTSASSSSSPASSSSDADSDSESETTEDKLNKLSSAKNVKKLKDLGDGEANIKNLLEEGETMTRSKRRLEIEKKLNNSKILRNEKVVQNVSPDKRTKQQQQQQQQEQGSKKSPLKRKDSCKSEDSRRKSESERDVKSAKKRQRKSSQIENNSSSEESEVEEEEPRTERLRPRKNKLDADAATKSTKECAKKVKAEKDDETAAVAAAEAISKTPDYKEGRRSLPAFHPFREDKTSKFTPGWEAETFNFKRTLKVPLDPQTSDTSEIFSEFVKSKDKEGKKDAAKTDTAKRTSKSKAEASAKKPPPPSSIIDLLHERVIQSKKKLKAKKAASINNSVKATTTVAVTSNSDDLLPTPQKESEKVFGFKKNIFEPFVITSRTRTENNAIRKKEVLKEVFGADDERPRSAPPSAKILIDEKEQQEEEEIEQSKPAAAAATVERKINFDDKYLEYLEKMNVDFPERKKIKLESAPKTTDIPIKVEEEEDFDDNETVVASERDLVTPTLKGKVKKSRARRCKGSSGFDYIRKKKKPTQNASENPLSAGNIIKKRLAAMENLEAKDENDISKEIKGWVLNKGVGESILHKAARLDYVDVVAYCLDRMNMNPDPKDNAGYTPLHEACSRGHLEIARLLLQYGASHSESALSGIRPLHEAIENGHIEMVRLLLSFGADPCLATYSGQMPISMAEDKEMEEFLNSYLVDIGHKDGAKTSWTVDGAYKIEDPDEIGYDIFSNVPIVKTDLGSSVASVLSTSMTSLITATTQMSDNETVISETATPLPPNKISPTQMKAPAQDFFKYQHKMMRKCDTNSNNLLVSDANSAENNKTVNNMTTPTTTPPTTNKKTKNCSVLLSNIDSTMKKIKKLPAISKLDAHIKSNEPAQKLDDIQNQKDDYDDMIIDETMESDCEFLEVEESEAPLPPLYLLRDEGTDKWVLLTDLCNLLKVKSKEAVLKQICPSSPPTAANKSELIRELKMSDFLEKAICLQLFCAGEKINVRASKVSLVRYNESVKNLLGVQTIRMNM